MLLKKKKSTFTTVFCRPLEKKITLPQKFSYCSKLAENFYKWIGNSNVEGFEGSNEHNNSILVSEWSGALC